MGRPNYEDSVAGEFIERPRQEEGLPFAIGKPRGYVAPPKPPPAKDPLFEASIFVKASLEAFAAVAEDLEKLNFLIMNMECGEWTKDTYTTVEGITALVVFTDKSYSSALAKLAELKYHVNSIKTI